MASTAQNTPIVLVLAGLDPSGGAGIQADIESVAANGGHATSVLTALTVQDTQHAYGVVPTDPDWILHAARTVLADLPVAAIKIGVVPDRPGVEAIETLLAEYPRIPVVLDPVLLSGGGDSLSEDPTGEALRDRLMPYATVITPNAAEAMALCPGADSREACAMGLVEYGCDYVLITGGDEAEGASAINRLANAHGVVERFTYPRLEGRFHGSGCTLASAIATHLGHGADPVSAVRQGGDYTWQTLRAARSLGRGQRVPDRFYWARDSEEG